MINVYKKKNNTHVSFGNFGKTAPRLTKGAGNSKRGAPAFCPQRRVVEKNNYFVRSIDNYS
jgi:hypothetical protein